MTLLEDFLWDCWVSVDDGDTYLLLSGDLNSRTANIFPELYDNTKEPEFQYTSAPLNTFSRKSEDSVLNNYGEMLLNLCTVFN